MEASEKVGAVLRSVDRAKAVLASGLQSLIDLCDQDRLAVSLAYTIVNDDDPLAYILSTNIHRRHMTKGQRAMAVAMIHPEPERGWGDEPR